MGGRLNRWMIFLQQFNYTIEYRPGKKHANADALSRRPRQSDHPGGIGDEGAGGVGGYDEASDDHDASGVGGNGVGGLLYPLENSGGAGGSGSVGGCGEGGKGSGAGGDTVCTIDQLFNSKPIDIKTAQANDAKLKPLLDALADGDVIPSTHPGLKMCFIKDSLLCREFKGVHNTHIQVILPSSLVPTVLRQLHNNGGHLGVHKTLEKVKERYYWPGYEQDVKTWTRECEQCQQRNPPQPQPQAPLGTIKATKPFEKVSWDIMGPLPPSESGNKYILVVTDLFTKWVEAFPIHDTTSSTLATVLVDQFITRYGVPVVLHSDQGANLCSEVIKAICKLLGMDKTRTSAYHPQGNGQVERFNRTLEAMLAKNVKDNQRDWDQWLQKVLFAYRTSLHETTGFTPFHLVFGRTPNLPVDIMLGRIEGEVIQGYPLYVQGLHSKLKSAFEQTRKKITTSHERRKELYDKGSQGVEFKVGDRVWLYTPAIKAGKTRKLSSLWRGPYTILDRTSSVNYRIQLIGSSTSLNVHRNRLKPCFGEPKQKMTKKPTRLSADPSGHSGPTTSACGNRSYRDVLVGDTSPGGEYTSLASIGGYTSSASIVQPQFQHPPSTRPVRERRPPDRYGSWVSH